MRGAFALCALALLASCGPSLAGSSAPAAPCPMITEAEYDAAKGATKATAKIAPNGVVAMVFGPQAKRCDSPAGALQVCANTADLVIRYEPHDAAPFFVRVPKGASYRFDVSKQPNTCEILQP